MKSLRPLLVLLLATISTSAGFAQPPVPHELLGHKASTFKVPRTRPFDWQNFTWMGGGPDLEEECGGCCHCFGRPAVWRAYDYIVPPDVPQFTVMGEYFSLVRDHRDHQNVLFDTGTANPVFSLSELEFDYAPGYRVSAQYDFTHLAALEAIYFRTQEIENDETLIDSLNVDLVAAGIVVVGGGVDPFQILYESQVQSGEANFKRNFCHGGLSLLTGARWLETEESLQIGERTAANQLLVETSNKLLGWQLGIEGQHWVDYGLLRIDGALKGGVYQNTAEQNSSFAAATASAEEGRTAWLGEARGALVLPITPHLFVRGGYHVMHLTGLATAADQLQTTDLAVPTATTNTDGRAIYHGWFVGLEAWW